MALKFAWAKVCKYKVNVYGMFWLHNDGPATTVRIGLPGGADND